MHNALTRYSPRQKGRTVRDIQGVSTTVPVVLYYLVINWLVRKTRIPIVSSEKAKNHWSYNYIFIAGYW